MYDYVYMYSCMYALCSLATQSSVVIIHVLTCIFPWAVPRSPVNWMGNYIHGWEIPYGFCSWCSNMLWAHLPKQCLRSSAITTLLRNAGKNLDLSMDPYWGAGAMPPLKQPSTDGYTCCRICRTLLGASAMVGIWIWSYQLVNEWSGQKEDVNILQCFVEMNLFNQLLGSAGQQASAERKTIQMFIYHKNQYYH